ncbi:unnamed protein product [Notodromas monacha]|uniref:Uncharacterized protein n=1 Tax=Notodromas monacha TaxID=399045 RepID=A0A7R9GDI3_9CRUS|nr:unnamed protein product [Notodromas monacha]CAG0916996.1 unnamed protein product [Notodromas monacha]
MKLVEKVLLQLVSVCILMASAVVCIRVFSNVNCFLMAEGGGLGNIPSAASSDSWMSDDAPDMAVEGEMEISNNPPPIVLEERTVKFPPIASDFIRSLEGADPETWHRLIEFMSVIRSDFLYEKTVDGARISISRKRAKLAEAEEEHALLIRSEEDLRSDIDARRKLIEDADRLYGIAVTKLSRAFDAVTLNDRNTFLKKIHSGEELLIALKDGESYHVSDNVCEIRVGGSFIRFGTSDDLKRFWFARSAMDAPVASDVSVVLKPVVSNDAKKIEDFDNRVRAIVKGTFSPTAHRASSLAKTLRAPNIPPAIQADVKPCSSDSLTQERSFRHWSFIFSVSKFMPDNPPAYFANVAANMNLTDSVYNELTRGDVKVPLPVPGTIVADFNFSTASLPWSMSGWSLTCGDGTLSATQLKDRIYSDLKLDATFVFYAVFIRGGTNDIKQLILIFAMGASPPCNKKGRFAPLLMKTDDQGIPLLPLSLRENQMVEEGRPFVLGVEEQMEAGRIYQYALYSKLQSLIGFLNKSDVKHPGWRVALSFAKDNSICVRIGLSWLGDPSDFPIHVCCGRAPYWDAYGNIVKGVHPFKYHIHCGKSGIVDKCFGRAKYFINKRLEGADGDIFRTLQSSPRFFTDDCFVMECLTYKPHDFDQRTEPPTENGFYVVGKKGLHFVKSDEYLGVISEGHV